CAGHPCRPAGMGDALPLPCFRSTLAGSRSGPKTPDLFSGVLIEGRNKTAYTLIAARGSGDDQTADGKRSARSVVVLMPIRNLRVRQQTAGMAVERDNVRVIGDHKHAVSGDANAAIDAAGRVADQSSRPRALVMPDLAAGSRVQRIAFVRAGHIHDAID